MNTIYAALFMLTPVVASAGQDVSSPYVAARVLQDMGYGGELRPNDTGSSDIYIGFGSWHTHRIMFMACETVRHCDEIRFSITHEDVGRSVTAARVRAYNSEQKWVYATVDAAGNATVTMRLNTKDGIDENTFKKAVGYWKAALNDFGDMLPY